MKSGVPNCGAHWQVNGVRQQAREMASEAARRAGMSVGEWLDSVILQSGQSDNVDTCEPTRDQGTRSREEFGEARSERPVAAPQSRSQLDQALDEIADRQRDLERYAAAEMSAPRARAGLGSDALPRPRTQELSELERQLLQINAQIEKLKPCRVDSAIDILRDDLAEIGGMLQQAMPRKAVEAIEHEVRNLAERIDQGRTAGADAMALASVERGLVEVRDALRAFAPAESLSALDRELQELSHKIDGLGHSTQDATAIGQLENAIAGLRTTVSRLASNEALTSLSDEVRALAQKVDRAMAGVDGDSVLNAIEHRIAALADALAVRNQAGQSMPNELGGAIRALGDKIERVQLPRGDQVALGQLEDRIAKLTEKLDASGGRLNHLEAIERGLAELLIHLERQRADDAARSTSPEVDELSRDVADIKQTGKKAHESLEALRGTLGHVVNRLSMIETEMRSTPVPATSASITVVPDPPTGAGAARPAAVRGASSVSGARSRAADRVPIDPSLPPDHPLEPGYGDARRGSPADRIAASESVLAEAKPPGAPAPEERPNFIAAARRAAQAASRAASTKRTDSAAGEKSSGGGKLARRVGKLRALFGGATATFALLVTLHVGRTLLDSSGSAAVRQVQRQAAIAAKDPVDATAAAKRTDAGPATLVASESTPPDTLFEAGPRRVPATPTADGISPLPAPGSENSNSTPPSAATPTQQPTTASTAVERDVTGSIPAPMPSAALAPASPEAEPTDVPASSAATSSSPAASTPQQQRSAPSPADKLPTTFGDRLRAAAGKGDAAAQYEVAQRYAEGRGIAQNLSSAAEWFERAAKQGLAPAQFRLAGLYEKGLGVKKNLETARQLYSAAGLAGNAKALHNLAVLYAEGIDGKPDYETAAKWFHRAATYGIADSQYNLAVLYAGGIGVEQNLTEAYKWFAIAAQDGDIESAKKRDELGLRLDQHSLEAATAAIQAWAPEHPPEGAAEIKTPPDGWDHAPASPLILNPKRKPLALTPKLDLSTPTTATQ